MLWTLREMTADYASKHVVLVVEGRGDANAVPVLLRKYLDGAGDYRDILGKPVTCNGHENAVRPGRIEGQVAVAAARPGCVGILVVLDSEALPVCELGPGLRERAL